MSEYFKRLVFWPVTFPRQYPSAGVGADLRVCPCNRDDTFIFATLGFASRAVLNDAQPVGHKRADTQVRPYGNPRMRFKTDATIADIPAGKAIQLITSVICTN